MAPFPLTLADSLGHWGQYVVFLIIGFAFGFVLELAGFGNSKKLAAQFYFKDLTVLKVMFGAIVTAMLLTFLTSALGLLDYNLVYVNPTYLWPGIVGGLIMGVGFIVGGFCPGTSLVSAATGRLDGIFFSLGVFFGIFLFGETVSGFEDFFSSSFMGRYTLPELFGVPTGVVVVGITVMALLMFYGGEWLEHLVGGKAAPAQLPRWRYAAAGGLGALALAILIIGQPTTEERWAQMKDEKAPLLTDRAVQIHPAELLDKLFDDKIRVIMLDVRGETDYNLFHVQDAKRVPLSEVVDKAESLRDNPPNTLTVVMSNDETDATEAWRLLTAESVLNVYILEGGVNGWIDTFGDEAFKAEHRRVESSTGETLHYTFIAALGDRYPAAKPGARATADIEYTPKVQITAKRGGAGGGCG